jgi:hypothetical protein
MAISGLHHITSTSMPACSQRNIHAGSVSSSTHLRISRLKPCTPTRATGFSILSADRSPTGHAWSAVQRHLAVAEKVVPGSSSCQIRLARSEIGRPLCRSRQGAQRPLVDCQ